MALRDNIEAEVRPKERARMKAEELRRILQIENRTLTRGQWTLTIESADLVRDAGGVAIGIEVFVRAYRNGREVHIDNRRRFVNPPLMSPDGTTRTEVTLSGDIIEVENFEWNPLKALLDCLIESIRTSPNPEGWVAP